MAFVPFLAAAATAFGAYTTYKAQKQAKKEQERASAAQYKAAKKVEEAAVLQEEASAEATRLAEIIPRPSSFTFPLRQKKRAGPKACPLSSLVSCVRYGNAL